MAYSPRLVAPSATDLHWISTSYDGYNPYMVINSSNGSVLPNCTAYAYGRFMEIMNKHTCKLPNADAGSWYGSCTAYNKGKEPKLGAVLCMSGGRSGHVAIVEQIHSDGSITVSESSYGGDRWRLSTFTKANGYAWPNSGYWYQGFIYNPSVSGSEVVNNKAKALIDKALEHTGEDSTWVTKVLGKKYTAWNAPFIIAVAKSVGNILNVVIPVKYSGSEIARAGVKSNYGSFLKGPYWGKSVEPKAGDLILCRFKAKSVYKNQDMYYSDRIGIVTEYDSSTKKVHVIEGNYGHKVATHEYSVNYKCINGYYRPKWAMIGGDPEEANPVVKTGKLYDHLNDRNDAMIREACYCNEKGEPSISKTNIRFSVINYTTLLSSIFKSAGVSVSDDSSTDYSADSVDTSKMKNTNAKNIANYLLRKGLNASQVVGILANIQAESGFRTDAVHPGSGASGLCQWTEPRRSAMIRTAGANWKNNLTGQCQYLWHELNSSEKATLNTLKADITAVNETAAADAADIFCRKFERPGDPSKYVPTRRKNAKELWKQLVIQRGTTSSTSNGKIVTQSGKVIKTAVKSVSIPNSVNQSGVSQNYTNYSYWYSRWASSSIQYKLAHVWNEQGRPSKRNIATISGYYLLAMTSTFGTTGDIVTIVLEDGTKFNAILGDAKGSDATNPYGHTFGNGTIDVIEWEKKGSSTINVDNQTQIDLSGWKGKKVSKVFNYGSWLR